MQAAHHLYLQYMVQWVQNAVLSFQSLVNYWQLKQKPTVTSWVRTKISFALTRSVLIRAFFFLL